MHRTRPVLFLSFIFLVATTAGWGQTFRGIIAGSVADSTGAVVPDATVKIEQKGTGFTRQVSTTTTGQFTFPDLPPGLYVVTVTKPGFQQQELVDVEVAVGKITSLPITLGVVERLLKTYPTQTAGMKDSGGDWNNTKAFLDAFAGSGFDVFAGSETFLLRNMRNGGAGCISATANVNPGPIAKLYDTWQGADADAQQARLDEIRGVFQKFPMIPALKAAIAHYGNDSAWPTVRPPLVALTDAETRALVTELDQKKFTMPGLKS